MAVVEVGPATSDVAVFGPAACNSVPAEGVAPLDGVAVPVGVDDNDGVVTTVGVGGETDCTPDEEAVVLAEGDVVITCEGVTVPVPVDV